MYPEVSAVTKSLQLDPANIVFVPITEQLLRLNCTKMLPR